MSTATITPTSSSNTLFVRVVLQLGSSANAAATLGLFVGAGSTAAACTLCSLSAGYMNTAVLEYSMTAGTTSPLTFTVGGAIYSGSLEVNYLNYATMGGTITSSISIEEIH